MGRRSQACHRSERIRGAQAWPNMCECRTTKQNPPSNVEATLSYAPTVHHPAQHQNQENGQQDKYTTLELILLRLRSDSHNLRTWDIEATYQRRAPRPLNMLTFRAWMGINEELESDRIIATKHARSSDRAPQEGASRIQTARGT